MSSSQHRASRCVFVGNIPYDATEEQLVQICEEVGPVVSFRLVVDRETGKPKGYGFCEFRDEETALSARRNLQGYEINGRQLRVDFAENEKGGGVDRSREQGRGGPGLQQQSYGYDAQKQPVSVLTHPGLHSVDNTLLDQPIGYQAATAAASVMAGALGNSQLAMLLSQAQGAGQMNGPSQANGNTDSLTSHLASMSKQQLYEVMLQMKALIQQNQQQARQLLVGNPQLTKALFQAQIMLGMVKPSQGGVTVQSNQQAQAQTSLGLQTNSVLSQQVAPQLQAQPRPAAGVPAQNVQQPLFQPASNQTQQCISQMQFQGSLPQGQLPIAYQQHGQQLPSQPLTQQAYQQMAANNLANSASRVGGEMGGVAMLGQGGVSGNTGMLGGNIGMGPQAGRGGLASGIMHHASQSSGNIGNLGGSHLLGSGNLAGGMGMSMVGGPMGNDVNPRIAYVAAGDVHAGNGYGQLQLQAMQQSQLQAQSHRQVQSQSQAQPQSQVQMELEQQKALLQQVLNLTPDQINLLPMEQRQQVIQLQQALR